MTTITADISLFDALRTQRSIRRFTSQPVPDEAIRSILKAATWAPSASNRQPWRFVVVRDPALKNQIGQWYDDTYREAGGYRPQPSQPARESAFATVPVLILVCIDAGATNPGPGSDFARGASIFPAVQNLMLAARALGLGTRPTTRHRNFEADIKRLLGIPDTVSVAIIVPLGYLAEGEHFGGKRRKPLSEVAFDNKWGQPLP